MRVADVQLAFPVIMLAIAIVAVVGTNPITLVGVLALSGWVLYARTIRAHVLTIRGLDYIDAAAMLGASDLRIILRHVLPNTVAPMLVIGSSQFATMVLLESGLSFLGMGIQAPLPSWGSMLAEGRDYLSNAWWLADRSRTRDRPRRAGREPARRRGCAISWTRRCATPRADLGDDEPFPDGDPLGDHDWRALDHGSARS